MFNFKNLFFTVLFSTVFIGSIIAQLPSTPSKSITSLETPKVREGFVSFDGGFTIALPQISNGRNRFEPREGVSRGGFQYLWRTPQASYTASLTELIAVPSNVKDTLQTIVDNFINLQEKNNNGSLISKKEISLDGMQGVEARLHIGADSEIIFRFYILGAKVYGLAASFGNTTNEATQLQILDSFKLIDEKTAIAKKLEEVTPAALPQSPVIKKTKSDVEDDKLKGKVKLVSESEEDLTGTANFSKVKLSSEDYYDEKGNQVKHLYYDYRNNPDTITIYGFIDGMRVSNTGFLHYEYNPPPPPAMMPPSKEAPKPVDSRYDVRYDYKYDEKRRLKEISTFNNKSEVNSKTVYIYDGNKVEKTSYSKDGKVNSKTIEIFNDKGNTIELTRVGNDKYPDSKYAYTYESFDKKGNWTKRIVTGKSGQYNGGYKDIHYAEYRTITYYQ